MVRIFLALAVAILIAFGIYSMGVTAGDDYYRQQRKSLELERAQRHADLDAQWAPFRTAVGNIAAATMVFVVIALAAGMGGLALAMFRNRLTLVRTDAAGRAPLRLDDPDYQRIAAATLAAFHRTELERAAQSAHVPASVSTSYAPRLSYEYEHTATGATSPGALVVEDTPESALPGLTDLATIPFAPSRQAVLLGLGAGGQLITVPPNALFHIALAGTTGSGKSNTARLLLPQLLALDARVCIADPNYTDYDAESGEDWRPIRQRLHLEPAYDDAGITEMLAYFSGELDRRLAHRREGKPVGKSIFLYCDELAEVIRQDKTRGDGFKRLVEQGRKVNIFILVASQDLLASTIGTSAASRENYRTAFWGGGDLHTGAALLDMPRRDLADWQPATGLAWLRSHATQPPAVVRIPLASNVGISRFLDGSMSAESDQVAIDNSARFDRDLTDNEATNTAAQSQKPLDARKQLVLQRFSMGDEISEIARGLNDGKTNGNYGRIVREVTQIIREYYQRGV